MDPGRGKMDNFELKAEPKVKRKPVIWNILTIVVLLGVCGLAYLFFTIFQNPKVLPAIFQPAALPTLYQSSTSTPTIIPQPATWTPTLTLQALSTRTKAPTWTIISALVTQTLTATPTSTPIVNTPTISPTAMPASAAISYLDSTTKHPDLACNWMGIGGSVMDANNKPLLFQTIQLGGNLGGKAVNGQVLSGNNPQYGASGFEFAKLADAPIASTQTLWIQLFDNNGTPLTDKIYFDTFNDCAKNLVMIVFTKTR
jgi:hypothetical protein